MQGRDAYQEYADRAVKAFCKWIHRARKVDARAEPPPSGRRFFFRTHSDGGGTFHIALSGLHNSQFAKHLTADRPRH